MLPAIADGAATALAQAVPPGQNGLDGGYVRRHAIIYEANPQMNCRRHYGLIGRSPS